MMGSKGIGRFAAAKLGSKMALTSTVQEGDESIAVLIPELDWSIFNDDVYLSDSAIDYLVQEIGGPTGTTIEIIELHEDWSSATFTWRGSFVSLDAPRHVDGAWVYGDPYFTAPESEYREQATGSSAIALRAGI